MRENCGRCVYCLDEGWGPNPDVPGIEGMIKPFRRRMVVCQKCGNKRCPHATDHELACTESNDPGQLGSQYGTPLPALLVQS